MKIKNLEEAKNKILEAIEGQKRILLYGDADLDGVCSVIILSEAILNLGGKLAGFYFPDREVEGYGISKTALDSFRDLAPALFITLDCGIGNFEEIKLAKKYGFEIIVIDHHQVLDILPEADIIVDPKQPGDEYPFKELATVGITFKLVEILLGEKMTETLRKNFLELVALATLADMMPQEDENRLMTDEGLEFLKNSWRPAFQVFGKIFKIPKELSKIISILNVRDVENNLPASFRILVESDFQKVEKLIADLLEKNKKRKEEIENILNEIESRISSEEKIIFEGSERWSFSLISAVASFLCNKYKKPVFIFKKTENKSQGTVRTPFNVDGVNLMKKCRRYLETFGGHAQASGFRIKNENIEKFKQCLIENL